MRGTIVPVGKRCAVYPNPASEYVAIQVSEMDGDAIIDVVNAVVNAVFSRRMAIVVGRASPDVTSLPSGTSAYPQSRRRRRHAALHRSMNDGMDNETAFGG